MINRVFDKSHLYVKGLDGKYLECNQSMVHDLGFSNDELIGKTDFDLSFLKMQDMLRIRKNDDMVIANEINQFFIEPCNLFDNELYIAFSQKSVVYSKINTKKIIGMRGQSLLIKKDKTITAILATNDVEDHPSLTKRQIECLYCIIKGYSFKETARYLSLSPKTVEHYINAIKSKLNCYSRSQLIKKGLKLKSIQSLLLQNDLGLLS